MVLKGFLEFFYGYSISIDRWKQVVNLNILEKEKHLEDFDVHHDLVEKLSEIQVNFVVLMVMVTGFNIFMRFLHILCCLSDMKAFLQGEKFLVLYLHCIIGKVRITGTLF